MLKKLNQIIALKKLNQIIACTIFHRKRELKTGSSIKTIREFSEVTKEFSKLPMRSAKAVSEIEKFIKEGKEEDKKIYEIKKK